jgi:hypothetical protein
MIRFFTPTGLRGFFFRPDLDGRLYTITCTYHERAASWYLDLDDADDVRIISGQRMVTGCDMLRHHRARDTRTPRGGLVVLSVANSQADPTLESLGVEHFLCYVLEADFTAIDTVYRQQDEQFTVEVL